MIDSTKHSTRYKLLIKQQCEYKESLNKCVTYTRQQLNDYKIQKITYEEYVVYTKNKDKLEAKKVILN